MTTPAHRSLAAALCLTALGCDTTLAKDDFATSCAVAADCVAVFLGDVCGCACPNAAISRDDQARYDELSHDLERLCNPLAGVCMADCMSAQAICVDHRCQVVFGLGEPCLANGDCGDGLTCLSYAHPECPDAQCQTCERSCQADADCPSGMGCNLPPLVPDQVPNICAWAR